MMEDTTSPTENDPLSSPEHILSPTAHDRYNRLRHALIHTHSSSNHAIPEDTLEDLDDPHMDESSPLLQVLRRQKKKDGAYLALPPSLPSSQYRTARTRTVNTGNPLRTDDQTPESRRNAATSHAVHPILYAEEAISVLLNGGLVYLACLAIGFIVIALKYEQHEFVDTSWWSAFLPIWIANVVLCSAYLRAMWVLGQLRKTVILSQQDLAFNDTNNEPWMLLMRRVGHSLLLSVPLALLLLWTELALYRACCTDFIVTNASPVGSWYLPLILMQLMFVTRYVCCASTSVVPGLASSLLLVFTCLLAYQTLPPSYPSDGSTTSEGALSHDPHHPRMMMSWWIVYLPLLAFDMVMFVCLATIALRIFLGLYQRCAPWQVCVGLVYLVGLVTRGLGQVLVWRNLTSSPKEGKIMSWLSFPSSMIFIGLVLSCVGMYLTFSARAREIRATRGGQAPLPLRRTSAGWIPLASETERWLLLGEFRFTSKGMAWKEKRQARARGNVFPPRVSESSGYHRAQRESEESPLVRRASGSYEDIRDVREGQD